MSSGMRAHMLMESLSLHCTHSSFFRDREGGGGGRGGGGEAGFTPTKGEGDGKV